MLKVSACMLCSRSDPVLQYGDDNVIERPATGTPPSSPIGDHKRVVYDRASAVQYREHAAEVFPSFVDLLAQSDKFELIFCCFVILFYFIYFRNSHLYTKHTLHNL